MAKQHVLSWGYSLERGKRLTVALSMCGLDCGQCCREDATQSWAGRAEGPEGFYMVMWEGPTGKLTLKPRPEGGEGMNRDVWVWGRDPEVGVCLACLRNSCFQTVMLKCTFEAGG